MAVSGIQQWHRYLLSTNRRNDATPAANRALVVDRRRDRCWQSVQHVFHVVVAVIHILVLVILDAGDENGYDDDYSYDTTVATTTMLRLRLDSGVNKDYCDYADDDYCYLDIAPRHSSIRCTR